MAVKGTISNFTDKGGSVSGYKAIPSGLTQGKRDPETGIVYKRPRAKIDNGLAAGGSVKIVNRNALAGRQARRRGSLGIGLVGSTTT